MPKLHAIAGQCDDARKEIAAGLALNRDNFTLERAARAQALCNGAEASRLSDELAERFPAATLTARIHRPVIAAALAVKQTRFRAGDTSCSIRSSRTITPPPRSSGRPIFEARRTSA